MLITMLYRKALAHPIYMSIHSCFQNCFPNLERVLSSSPTLMVPPSHPWPSSLPSSLCNKGGFRPDVLKHKDPSFSQAALPAATWPRAEGQCLWSCDFFFGWTEVLCHQIPISKARQSMWWGIGYKFSPFWAHLQNSDVTAECCHQWSTGASSC